MLFAIDLELTCNREGENVSRETTDVVPHPLEVSQPRGSFVAWRLVARDYRATLGIASDAVPLPIAVHQQSNQTEQRDQHAAIIGEEPLCTTGSRRSRNQSFGKCQDDRKAFVAPEWLRKPVDKHGGVLELGRAIR